MKNTWPNNHILKIEGETRLIYENLRATFFYFSIIFARSKMGKWLFDLFESAALEVRNILTDKERTLIGEQRS